MCVLLLLLLLEWDCLRTRKRECEGTRVLAVSERGRVCIITDVG